MAATLPDFPFTIPKTASPPKSGWTPLHIPAFVPNRRSQEKLRPWGGQPSRRNRFRIHLWRTGNVGRGSRFVTPEVCKHPLP